MHDDVLEVQPAFHVQLVGLFVHEDEMVIVWPTSGVGLLDESVHAGGCGVVCVQFTPAYARPPVPAPLMPDTPYVTDCATFHVAWHVALAVQVPIKP